MLSLPCAASGQEDGVCVALTQLSKELLESNSATMQAGGCDSSDCLFCQYRSNSPFHLNAYAGKLTSLLRKRSANGMTLASLNCFIDAPSKQGAALLTAATSPDHSSGKRQRAASSTGIQGPVAQLPRSAPPPPSETAEPLHSPLQPQASDEPTNSHSTFEAKASQTLSCESPSYLDQGLPSAQPQRVAAATSYVACPSSISDAAGDTDTPSTANTTRICASSVGARAEAAASTPNTDLSLHRPHHTPTRSNNASIPEDNVDATFRDVTATATLCGAQRGASHVEPHPSSHHHHHHHVSAPKQLSNCPSSHLRDHISQHHDSQYNHQQHQQLNQAPYQRLPSEPGPRSHPHPRTPPLSNHSERYHLPAATALPLPPSTTPTSPPSSPQPPSRTATGRTTQPRPASRHRLDLPRGWTFRPEWEDRSDPAPAELREVLRLPVSRNTSGGAGSCTAARGARSAPGRASVSLGRGVGVCGGADPEIRGPSSSSAGIVCSLEFSPDGRLLAAGGVDKQIRLYNLSEVLGDHDDSDDYLGGLDDELDDELLPPSLRTCQGLGQGGDRRQGASGHRMLRRTCACSCEGSDDEDGDGGFASLLATVQRMPSKISSIAWSPFLDGVLTVGDYDGVLLQLHMDSGHQLADVEAHGGRKIWSVSHSALVPHLVASAADDRTARLWSGAGLSSCVATLQPNPRASVCSVDFSAAQEHLLALACSDRTAYLYDLRAAARGPLVALMHHTRPASYCRFMGGQRLVTAATDASIALWDISGAVPSLAAEMYQPIVRTSDAAAAAAAVAAPLLPVNAHASCRMESMSPPATDFPLAADKASDTPAGVFDSVPGRFGVEKAHRAPTAPASGSAAPSAATHTTRATTDASLHALAPCRIFRGHCNEKNFVGLTVRAADGLLACGSECNRAFAYHTSWAAPLATLGRGSLGWGARKEHGGGGVLADGDASGGGGAGMQYDITGWVGGGVEGGFVSAVCWQPAEAAALLGLPPLLASATSRGVVSISVLTAATRGQ